MEVLVDRWKLAKLLEIPVKAADSKAAGDMLDSVLVSACGETLTIVGGYGTIAASSTLSGVSCQQEGKICLNAGKLMRIVSALPEDCVVKISGQATEATIRAGRVYYKLAGIPGDDFPVMQNLQERFAFYCPESALKSALRRVSHAMAKKDVRYYLNGMLIDVNPSERTLTLVATDGHRLAMESFVYEQPSENVDNDAEKKEALKCVIPLKTVALLEKALQEKEEPGRMPVGIIIGKTDIEFVIDGMAASSIRSALVGGNFPDYRAVLTSQDGDCATVGRKELLMALRHSEKIDIKFNMRLSGDGLEILSESIEHDTAQIEIDAVVNGEEKHLCFQTSYMIDALSACDDDEVKIFSKDPSSPVLLVGNGGELNAQFVVMPRRI